MKRNDNGFYEQEHAGESVFAAMANAMVIQHARLAPRKNCGGCVFSDMQWRDGGHCYFYREEPISEFCAQFEARPQGDHSP